MAAQNKKRVKRTAASTAASTDVVEEQKEEPVAAESTDVALAPPAFDTAAVASAATAPVMAVPFHVAKTDRSMPLIVMQRRRTVLSLLAAAPSQLLTLQSLNRSLTTAHPPAMDKKTFNRFYDAMQYDNLLTVYTFMFPRQSGRGSHQVSVAALRVKGVEEDEASAYERKRLAHELAMVQLSESGTREKLREEKEPKGEEEEDDPAWLETLYKPLLGPFSASQQPVMPVKTESTSSTLDDTASTAHVRQQQSRQQATTGRRATEESKDTAADDVSDVDERTGADGGRKRDALDISRSLLGFIGTAVLTSALSASTAMECLPAATAVYREGALNFDVNLARVLFRLCGRNAAHAADGLLAPVWHRVQERLHIAIPDRSVATRPLSGRAACIRSVTHRTAWPEWEESLQATRHRHRHPASDSVSSSRS